MADAAAAAQIVRNKTASRLIPVLENTDPTSFINFEAAFRMNSARTNWDAAESKYQAKAKIRGDALAMCRHIPHDTAGEDLDTFLTALRNKFVPAAAGTAARANYRNAYQLPEQSIKQFSSQLLELFFLAYPNRRANYDADADLIEHFLTRLACPKTAELVMGQSPATYTDAYNAAESITASQIIMASVRNNKPAVNQLGGPSGPSPPGQGQKRKGDLACFGCGRTNHILKDCFEWLAFKKNKPNQEGPARGRGRGRARGFRGGFQNRGGRRPFPGRVNQIDDKDGDQEASQSEEHESRGHDHETGDRDQDC